MNITWKVLVCGFIQRDCTKKLEFYNLILSLVMYSIFKQNSKCKFENISYKDSNIKQKVKLDLGYQKCILQCTNYGIYSTKLFDEIMNVL